jgi:single-stranded-DNA-specific exonuclease
MAGGSYKRWIFKEADAGTIARHVAGLGVSPFLARMLALRGLSDCQAAKRYLSSTLRSDLPSPFLLKDMDAAADRVLHAIKRSELIAVWGDYDVDGTTGAAVVICFLRRLGIPAVYYVPHRIEEGYGLNLEGLRRLREAGVQLVVTIDCGMSNAREVEAAKEFGLDIVIVDHHQPPEALPPALAVINPHRPDCSFPDKGLCAAGLAFYLVIAIRAKLRDAGWFTHVETPDLRPYLDIVTLGTIADMVPLNGVNRTLIRRGLYELGNSARAGVAALKRVANIAPGEVSAGHVGFRLGPRINAAGRVDTGIKVVELLTTHSEEVALRIAHELDAHNQERRAIEAEVLEQALLQANSHTGDGEPYTLVLQAEGWHPGVLGIVASRIVERFYRPTVVIGFDGAEGKGSARSIRGFHMVEGFRRCHHLLEKYGGHEYAGGLTIKAERLSSFIESFERFARECLSPEDLLRPLEIDASLDFAQIGMPMMQEIDSLKPFGVGNPEPLFMTRNAEVCERKMFGSGARFRLRQGTRFLGAVAFGVDEAFCAAPGATVDLVYRLDKNEWNGSSTVELNIVDARPAEA